MWNPFKVWDSWSVTICVLPFKNRVPNKLLEVLLDNSKKKTQRVWGMREKTQLENMGRGEMISTRQDRMWDRKGEELNQEKKGIKRKVIKQESQDQGLCRKRKSRLRLREREAERNLQRKEEILPHRLMSPKQERDPAPAGSDLDNV